MSAISTYRVSSLLVPSLFSDSTEPSQRISILSRQAPLSTEPSDSLITDWTFSKILSSEAPFVHPKHTHLKPSAFEDVASLDDDEKCDFQMRDQKDRYFSIQVSKDHPILNDSIYCQNASFLGSKTSAGANHRTVLFPKKLFDTRLIEQLFTQGAACISEDNFMEVVRIADFIGSRSLITVCNGRISESLKNYWRKGECRQRARINEIPPYLLSILADRPDSLMLIAATDRSSNDLALDLDSINLNRISVDWIEWIAKHAAKNNNKDVMQVLIKEKNWERSEALIEAVKCDSHDVIKVFLTDEKTSSYKYSAAIEEAVKRLERLDPWEHATPLTSVKKDRVLGARKLLLGNKLDTLKLIWPKAGYKGRNLAIVAAAHQGSLQLVKGLLANRIIPEDPFYSRFHIYDNFIVCCVKALSYAAKYGFLEIVKELLVNGQTACSSRSEALIEAATYGFPEIVQVLLAHEQVSRVFIIKALDAAKEGSQNKEVIKILEEQLPFECSCAIS